MIALVWRFKADKYKFPKESVRDNEEVMHNLVFYSKHTLVLLYHRHQELVFYDWRLHFSVGCWLEGIDAFSHCNDSALGFWRFYLVLTFHSTESSSDVILLGSLV